MPYSYLTKQLNSRLTDNSNTAYGNHPSKIDSLTDALRRKMESLRSVSSLPAPEPSDTPGIPQEILDMYPEGRDNYTGPYVSDGRLPQNIMSWDEYRQWDDAINNPVEPTSTSSTDGTEVINLPSLVPQSQQVQEVPKTELSVPQYEHPSPYVAQMDRNISALLDHYHQAVDREKRLEGTWIDQLGLEPGSFWANRVEQLANLHTGGARFLGQLTSAPINVHSLGIINTLSEEDFQAYNRVKAGTATEADHQRLQETPEIGENVSMQGMMRQASFGNKTKAELIEDLNKNLKRAERITEFFDTSHTVFGENQEKLQEDLKQVFQNNWNDVTQGWSSIQKGELASGAVDMAKGLASMLLGIGQQAVTNPNGVMSYVMENAPQVIVGSLGPLGMVTMAASNAGYALDQYREGFQKYMEENNGQLPPEELRTKMAWYTASLAAAEYVGNLVQVRNVRALRDALRKPAGEATKAAAKTTTKAAAKTGVVAAGKRVIGAGGKGFVGEFPTEAWQEYAEGEIKQDPASAEDIFVAGTIGGLSGGGISGGGRALAETGQAITARRSADRGKGLPSLSPEQQETFRRAVEANDPSVYLNPEDRNNYNPVRAAGVLHSHAMLETTSPEVREQNLAQIDTLLAEVESQRERTQSVVNEGSEQNIQTLTSQVSAIQTRLEQTDVTDERYPVLQRLLKDKQQELSEAQSFSTSQEYQSAQRNLKRIEERIEGIERIRSELYRWTQEAAPSSTTIESLVQQASAPNVAPEEQQQTAQRVLSMVMRSPESTTPEQVQAIAENTDLPLTEEQRNYLRRLSDTRVAENAAKGLKDVSREVFEGDLAKNQVGIRNYRTRVFHALQRGNLQRAREHLAGLQDFALSHRNKAAAIRQALERSHETGEPVNVVRVRNTQSWTLSEEAISPEKLRKNGGISVEGGKSYSLYEAVQAESTALNAAEAELQAAISLHENTGEGRPAPSGEASLDNDGPVAQPTEVADNFSDDVSDGSNTVVGNEEGLVDTPSTPIPEVSTEESVDTVATVEAPQPPITQEEDTTLPAQETASQVEEQSVVENAELTVADEEAGADTALEAAQAFQETQQEQAEQQQQDEGVTQDGTLDAVQETTPEGTARNEQRFGDLFTQSAGKDTDATLRPLVAVKDFLSQLRDQTVRLGQFLASKDRTITEKQVQAIQHFYAIARDWASHIQKDLVLGDPKYYYRYPLQYLVRQGENGLEVEENLATAIAFGGYTWVQEVAGSPYHNDTESINRILGRDPDHRVSHQELKALATAGVEQGAVAHRIGQQITSVLGIRAKPETPKDMLPRLQTALGLAAIKMLLEAGVVESKQFSRKEMATLFGGENIHQRPHFIRIARQNGRLNPVAQGIVDATRGTQNILERLFGAEAAISYPSLEPINKKQKRAQNSWMGIPSKLRRIINKKHKEARNVREDTWKVVSGLNANVRLALAGYNFTPLEHMHIENRLREQAKNDAIVRELELFQDFVDTTLTPSEQGLATDFYLDHTVWKQQRVGIATQAVNPQQYKTQRYLVYSKNWVSEISLDNEAAMNNFLLRVAEGFGFKTDRRNSKRVLEEIKQTLGLREDGTLAGTQAAEVIESLRRNIYEDVSLDAAAQQTLQEAVAEAGEAFKSLDALIAMAHYKQAQQTGQPSFTTSILAEVDGVNNGPILAHIMLGAGSSLRGLAELLKRGGIFTQESTEVNYNLWRDTPGSLDLYEVTMRNVFSRVNAAMSESPGMRHIMQTISYFTGELADNDVVTSAGRDFIKTPMNSIVYGSSMKTAIKNMSSRFIDEITKTIEKHAEYARNPETRQLADPESIIKGINTMLIASGWKVRKIPSMSIEALLERPFTDFETRAIQRGFEVTFGTMVQETIEHDFATFLDRNQTNTNTAEAIHTLYNAVYEAVVADHTKGKSHDITPQEEAEIQKMLAGFAPHLHTLFSKESNDLSSGLHVSRSDIEAGPSTYEVEAKFNTPIKGRGKSKSTRARGRKFVTQAPGVAMGPLSTHSLDSYISHMVQDRFDLLNMHDSVGLGVKDIQAATQELNKRTWHALLNYSPASELYDSLARGINGLYAFLEDQGYPQQVMERLATELVSIAEKREMSPYDYLEGILKNVRENAYHADLTKFSSMETWAAVNQYALEGGHYEVSDTDRATAARRKENLNREIPEGTLHNIAALQEALRPFISQASEARQAKRTEDVITEDAEEVLPKAKVLGFSPARAMQLLDHGRKDETLDEQTRNRMDTILREMVTNKVGLQEAIQSVLEGSDAAQMVQLLSERYQAIPEDSWGEIGPSPIKSDPYWVNVFEKRPNLTARQVVGLLRQRLGQAQNQQVTGFHQQMLRVLEKILDPSLVVRYVTPATHPDQVSATPGNKARGWYVYQGNGEIYVLSPDYTDSGLTSEVLLHELVHAALYEVIESDQSPEVRELVQELEALRELAKEHVEQSGLSDQFDAATENIHEFIAWGMTNLSFQREVLSKITMQSKTQQNKLVQGMRAFVERVTGILFGKSAWSKDRQMVSGMGVLISNVSGLYHQAALSKPDNAPRQVLSMESRTAMDEAKALSTIELFEALGEGTPQGAFQSQLRGLLQGIVEKVHGPFGSFKAKAEQGQAVSALDAFQKAMDTGKAPFASRIHALGLPISAQESYVIEQVEATVRSVLEDRSLSTTRAYRELERLYNEAAKRLRAQDFYKGDWAHATDAEKTHAQELYDFLFALEQGPDGKLDYLSRFAALGLAHERVNQVLRSMDAPAKPVPSQPTFIQRLRNLLDSILELFSGRAFRGAENQKVAQRIEALVDNLVDIESRHRIKVGSSSSQVMDALEKVAQGATTKARETVVSALDSPLIAESRSGIVKAFGRISTKAAEGRVGEFMDVMRDFRAKHLKARSGTIAGTLRYVQGYPRVLQAMIQGAKFNERVRKSLISETAKLALESFADNGQYLTEDHKAAITDYILRTNAQALMDDFSFDEIAQLIRDKSALDTAIAQWEQKIDKHRFVDHYIQQAKGLAYFMTTGIVRNQNQMRNTHNIVTMAGTRHFGKANQDNIAQDKDILDVLVSLYALQYTPQQHRKEMLDVLGKEFNRSDQGNGIEFVLRQHRALLDDSTERLFSGSEALRQQGYIPEVMNPGITPIVANEKEAKVYRDMGYMPVGRLRKDPADNNRETHYLFAIQDGGNLGYVSQIFSLTDMHASGTQRFYGGTSPDSFIGNLNAQELARFKALHQRGADNPSRYFDPTKSTRQYAMPLVNASGDIVNYRYMMQHTTKDAQLERDNRFEVLLGTFAGNTFDKQATRDHNKKAVEMFLDIYKEDYGRRSEQYLEVGPHSQSKEMREIWRMLPDQTKQDIKKVWGEEGMMIRSDLIDIAFGYRKASISNLFSLPKEERNWATRLFVGVFEGFLEHYAKQVKGMDEQAAKNFSKKAAILVRRGEEGWQEIVRETKDIIVVKTGVVLAANIWSNLTVLKMYGISFSDLARDHLVAYRATKQYRADQQELLHLQRLVELDYGIEDLQDIQRRITQLEDAMKKNPIAELYEAGMMPTIVDDVVMDEDKYSYKSRLTQKVENILDKSPEFVGKAARFAYMSRDSAPYQFLYETTQLSDFVARYVLHKHLTTRAKNPLSDEDAKHLATEAFVNYDIAMPRRVQYLDDMGIIPFSKYFLSIQRVLAHLVRDQPLHVALTLLGNNMLDVFPTVMDSSVLTRLGNNPLYTGALRYPELLGELPTVKGAMGLFK